MSAPVDIIKRGRDVATVLDCGGNAMAPGVAERLTRYRVACRPCALTHEADPNSGVGAMRPRSADRIADDVEDMAHAMLAAEREPEAKR